MIDPNVLFLEKALESLAGAESEAVNGRYNNSANRSYYACFQAAIAALMQARVRPPGGGDWGHGYVAAQFDGLINRRKLYPAELRGVLIRNRDIRRRADYTDNGVTQIEASRALQRTRRLIAAVQSGGGIR
jgi:uncharacterized protein (UPF0332 family)